jgi:hypothetical protein
MKDNSQGPTERAFIVMTIIGIILTILVTVIHEIYINL